MQFRRIAVSVLAAQVSAILASQDKAPQFIKDANAAGTLKYGSDYALVTTPAGEVKASTSDWILQDGRGLRVKSDADFKADYVADEGKTSAREVGASKRPAKKKPAKKATPAKKAPAKKAAKKAAAKKGGKR